MNKSMKSTAIIDGALCRTNVPIKASSCSPCISSMELLASTLAHAKQPNNRKPFESLLDVIHLSLQLEDTGGYTDFGLTGHLAGQYRHDWAAHRHHCCHRLQTHRHIRYHHPSLHANKMCMRHINANKYSNASFASRTLQPC